MSHRIFSPGKYFRSMRNLSQNWQKKGEDGLSPFTWMILVVLEKPFPSWSLAHCCFAGGHPDTSVGQVHTHPPQQTPTPRGSRQLVHGSWAVLVWMVNALPDISSQEACMTPLLPHPQPLRHHWMFWNRVSSCRTTSPAASGST